MKLNNRNRKTRLKRLGFGVLILLAVLLLFNSIQNWRAGARLEAKLTELRASGAPTSIRELAPKEIPYAQNAAATLAQARQQLQTFSKDHGVFYDSPLGKDYDKRLKQGDLPTDEQIKEIESILTKHRALLALVREASRQTWYVSKLDFSLGGDQFLQQLIDETPAVRSAARLMVMQMQATTFRGEIDEAASLGIDLLRLSRLQAQEPTVVNYLIAVACRQVACRELNKIVRKKELPDEMRNELNVELDQQTGLNGLQQALETERALGLDIIAGWRRGIGVPGKLLGWQYTFWQSELIDYYDELLPKISKPWHVDRGCFDRATGNHSTVIQLILPAVQSCYEAANRDLATQRCLLIVNELARYEANHDQPATGLADLNLTDEQTLDPFSGKPLIVKPTDQGWAVYSVFINGKDDGGEQKEMLDWGLMP